MLWYKDPAKSWMMEALPVGNGRMGAMVFGGTGQEVIQFNVDSLWTGDEDDAGMYQKFGEMVIDFSGAKASYADYRRELSLADAVHRVSFSQNGTKFLRELFASHPDGVIALRVTADGPGALAGSLTLKDAHQAVAMAKGDEVSIAGSLDNGLKYEARAKVVVKGGTLSSIDSKLAFQDASELIIYLAADTNYLPDRHSKWRGEEPGRKISKALDSAASKSYEALRAAHVADYWNFFGRVTIDLGSSASDIASRPTNERLQAATTGGNDPELEALLFNYARYLMISCSRPGTLPANLQGIWNNLNTPPWRCDYHSNINVQMNYWLAETGNLAELHVPFFDYVDSQNGVYREKTREEYGNDVRGWTVRTENNIFGAGDFKWNPPGSAWYSRHFWEHYEFGGDREFLRSRAYPLLKEICEFWEDRLIQRSDGTLVTTVGWSPEHGPEEEAITYDMEIVRDLFTNYLHAADALGADRDYRDKIAGLRDRLLKLKIGRWGQLQEWEEDKDDPNDDHRHVSHLYALYPASQISPIGTPELAKATRTTLEARGDESTGWSKAWKIAFWARLLDGDHAYKLLRNLMHIVEFDSPERPYDGGGLSANLFCSSPPFQIDGNFGVAAGMIELLLQSQNHAGESNFGNDITWEIHLLPALPRAWKTGAVTGLRARGGFTVDLAWKDGKCTGAAIRSEIGGSARVRCGDRTISLELKPGQTARLDGSLIRQRPGPVVDLHVFPGRGKGET
jgi:alpha-L-fucosidase 2